jgi:FlaA1/EpsC-like NDP-sugar epimerase
LVVFALASGEHFRSYYVFYGAVLFGTAYITALRAGHLWLTGWLLECAGLTWRALVVGSSRRGDAVVQALAGVARTKVEVVGYISSSAARHNALGSVGQLEELPRVLTAERVRGVIIADPEFPPETAVELVDICHREGVTVHVAPSTTDVLIDRAEFEPGQSVPLFKLRPPVFDGIDYALKRMVDITLSSVGLILLGPLLLAIAAAVKFGSRGPVIYRSVRPGIRREAVRLPQVPDDA